ncbi:MAG: hypothetical protein AMXMBFR58_08320 [Phycisphaerae bacterium]
MRHLAVFLAVAICALASGSRAAEPVTTASLVASMSDLEALTRLPAPGTRVVQFSSYDRRSSMPGGPGWFGNADGFGGEPIPGFESVAKEPGPDGVGTYVICDVQQPGAIVRTWTAAIDGTIRVYLDGSATPVYDGPAYDFLMHHATALGKAAGLSEDEDALKSLAAFEQRYSDYFPIPFARSCRIEWIGDLKRVHFYHVQLKLFPAGTPVTPYSPAELMNAREAITASAKALRDPAPAPNTTTREASVTVPPHEERQLLALEGQGAVRGLDVVVNGHSVETVLRGVLLKVSFDGHETPQIVAPIGDFFGAAPGRVPFQTLPMAVDPRGVMSCRFVMPHERSAVFTAVNTTDTAADVTIRAATGPYAWDDRSMHLRARWRVDHDLTARGGPNAVDLPFLAARGTGVYVGTAVYIMNPCPVPTAGGNWWGEGDEKVFVDGEDRPSIFGTGSEDYFNYAWSESDIFQYPYFAQPICTGPDTRGYITNTRWHISDAIPFESSIDFAMELFAHTPTPHLSYARMSYWYGRPGSTESAPGVNTADLRVPALPAWTVRAAGGATNASIFEAEAARDPEAPSAVVEHPQYSAGAMVRFTGGEGVLRVTAPAAGRYRVVLTCVSGEGPVGFDAKIGDHALKLRGGERFEIRPEPFTRILNLWTEPVELAAGEQTLRIGNIEDPQNAGVGVDFVWLRPEK